MKPRTVIIKDEDLLDKLERLGAIENRPFPNMVRTILKRYFESGDGFLDLIDANVGGDLDSLVEDLKKEQIIDYSHNVEKVMEKEFPKLSKEDVKKVIDDIPEVRMVAGVPYKDMSDSPHWSVRNRKLYKNGNGWNYPSTEVPVHIGEEENSKRRPKRKGDDG